MKFDGTNTQTLNHKHPLLTDHFSARLVCSSIEKLRIDYVRRTGLRLSVIIILAIILLRIYAYTHTDYVCIVIYDIIHTHTCKAGKFLYETLTSGYDVGYRTQCSIS